MSEPETREYGFTAFAIGGDLDLNRLATRLGIDRKYRWEEPMRLNPVTFTPSSATDAVWVYLYYFGGIVFLNCSDDIVAHCIEGLKQHLEQLREQPQLRFREDYQLEIDPAADSSITNDAAIVPEFKQELLEIIRSCERMGGWRGAYAASRWRCSPSSSCDRESCRRRPCGIWT